MLEKVFIYTYMLSLAIPGRWRLMPELDHYGGAEVAISPYDIPLFSYLFVKMILVCLSYSQRNISITINKDILVVVAYVYINAMLIIFAESIFWSSLEIFRYIKFSIIFLILRNSFSKDELAIKSLFNMFLIVIVLQILTSIIQQVFGLTLSGKGGSEVGLNNIDGDYFRSTGTLGHPGTLSQFVVIIAPFLWLEALNSKVIRKALFMTGYVLCLLIVVLTFARTGIALIAVTSMLMVFHSLISKGKFFSKALICVSILLSGLYFFDSYYSVIYDRFANAPDESGSIRVTLAEIAFNMISKYPISGVGLNCFTDVMKLYDPTNIVSWWPHPVHNIFILILAETGFIGFSIFMYLNFHFIRNAILGFKMRINPHSDYLYAALVSLFSIAMFGMLGWSWRLDSVQGLYWIILAVISSSLERLKLMQSKTD